jgi:EAL domain-containing protein (putative c-di-GMP-specific phosphodiesterase class I)
MTQNPSLMRPPTLNTAESAATWTGSEAVAYIHDGMHVFANDTYINLFKYSDLDEVLATPFMDMVAEECRKELKLNLRICQNSARPNDEKPEITRMEIVAIDAEKAAFPANLSLKPTYYEGENCLQVLVISKQAKAAVDTRIVVTKKCRHRNDEVVDVVYTDVLTFQAVASAIENDTLILVYFPVVSTFALEPVFYDIHPQMYGPDRKVCTAEQITTVAGDTALALQIDRWVFTHAIRLLGYLRTQGRTQQFQLTVTAQTLRDSAFCDWLNSQLAECGVAADCLVVNMRESDVLANAAESKVFIRSLHDSGSRVCISGYTNREEIAAVVAESKVDFVRFDNDISEANSLHMLSLTDLKKFVDKLHQDDVKVIAADVQDKETVDSLWLAEVDLVQGAWFQKEAQELHAKSFRAEAPVLRNAV